MRTVAFGLVLSLAGSIYAQFDYDRASKSYWVGGARTSFGQNDLGSEDQMRGTYYWIGRVRPEPRFTWNGNTAQIVYSGFYFFAKNSALNGNGVQSMHSYGVTVSARYWNHWFGPGMDSFLDLGWGMMYSNKLSVDLSTRVNSTPWLGIGIAFPVEGTELFLTVHWFHASNAGTRGPNQGSNQIQYGIAFKF